MRMGIQMISFYFRDINLPLHFGAYNCFLFPVFFINETVFFLWDVVTYFINNTLNICHLFIVIYAKKWCSVRL